MKIEIIVSPSGDTRVETKGIAGTTCRDASRALEQALGLVESEQLTGEFFQFHSTEQPVQQRQ